MDKFARIIPLIGIDNFNKLQHAKILVLGCGGVGGACIESLVRSGIENITIIDNDTVSISNINRQIIALNSTLGLAKVEVMKNRILDINSNCKVFVIQKFITPLDLQSLDLDSFDYIIDAIDTITTKIALAEFCYKEKVSLISSMGTGNRLDPTKFKIIDVFNTQDDPIARIMRYELRKRGIKKLDVLISEELPIKIDYNEFSELKTEYKNIAGSISFVPPVAGMIITSYVIKRLLKN